MSIAITSRRYATALLDVAEDTGILDTLTADLELIGATLDDSADLQNVLKSPLIKGDAKARALKAVFAGRISDKTVIFLELVCKKKRAAFLAQIIKEYRDLCDERAGLINVDVKTATRLDDSQSKELIDALATYTGKKVRARLALDESLLGGVTVKIGDTVLDGSVSHQLNLLKSSLAG